jgi:aminoglycoside phosphotransferase (APT) family kinase protein
LRTLHALPPFPTATFNTTCTFLLNKGPALDGFFQKFRAASIAREQHVDEIVRECERLAGVYASLDRDLVPSHNDLFKPDNILFDGSRLWLVDWEAAFQNDRYADLAVVGNMLVANEAEEQIYLEAYFGRPPSSYEAARFYVMKQLAHIFYAMAFLGLTSASVPAHWSEPIPMYTEFQRRFWAREVHLDDDHSKILYGRVHWEQIKDSLRLPRLHEALTIVASRRDVS